MLNESGNAIVWILWLISAVWNDDRYCCRLVNSRDCGCGWFRLLKRGLYSDMKTNQPKAVNSPKHAGVGKASGRALGTVPRRASSLTQEPQVRPPDGRHGSTLAAQQPSW